MPKVSVLMPVYNTKEEYLREAIESILAQTFEDFEFVIINDGSTNNAEEVILSYLDERILYIKNIYNLQLIHTLNQGLALCQGEYIARFDSDDISLPARLEKQVRFMDVNKNIGVVASGYEWMPDGSERRGPSSDIEIKETLLFEGCVIPHPCVMLRRSLDVQYDSKYLHAEDYALWLDLIEKTKFAIIPESLLRYRWHGENISIVYGDIQHENAKRARYAAQLKYYGKDETLCDVFSQEKISLLDLVDAADFCIQMGAYGGKHHRAYYKALKRMQKTWCFIKFLWFHPVNGKLGISVIRKLKITLNVF